MRARANYSNNLFAALQCLSHVAVSYSQLFLFSSCEVPNVGPDQQIEIESVF